MYLSNTRKAALTPSLTFSQGIRLTCPATDYETISRSELPLHVVAFDHWAWMRSLATRVHNEQVTSAFAFSSLLSTFLPLGKETRALLDMPRPVTACFYNSLPHYHGLTKRETTAVHCARDRDPKKKVFEWDLDIEAYVFKDYA